jgi:hypothetical protein
MNTMRRRRRRKKNEEEHIEAKEQRVSINRRKRKNEIFFCFLF